MSGRISIEPMQIACDRATCTAEADSQVFYVERGERRSIGRFCKGHAEETARDARQRLRDDAEKASKKKGTRK